MQKLVDQGLQNLRENNSKILMKLQLALCVPLITGPGAITGVVILSGKAPTNFLVLVLLFSVIISMFIFYFILKVGNYIGQKIGIAEMRVIERMMGLILVVIAV